MFKSLKVKNKTKKKICIFKVFGTDNEKRVPSTCKYSYAAFFFFYLKRENGEVSSYRQLSRFRPSFPSKTERKALLKEFCGDCTSLSWNTCRILCTDFFANMNLPRLLHVICLFILSIQSLDPEARGWTKWTKLKAY